MCIGCFYCITEASYRKLRVIASKNQYYKDWIKFDYRGDCDKGDLYIYYYDNSNKLAKEFMEIAAKALNYY